MGQESLGNDIGYVRPTIEKYLDEYLKIVNDLSTNYEEDKIVREFDDEQTRYTKYIKEIWELKRQIENMPKKNK